MTIDDQLNDIVNAKWYDADITYKLHSGQIMLWNHIVKLKRVGVQEVYLDIARQFGKSYFSCVYAIAYCIRYPRSIVRIAAPTLKQARDIVQDNLDVIVSDAPKGLITQEKSDYRWKIGESSLRLGVLERAHVDSLRGGNARLIILEEGGFVKSDDYVYALQSVIAPQLLRSQGQLIHITTKSEDPDHYLHSIIEPKTRISNSYFMYSVYDNPQLTAEQIDKAKEMVGGEHSIAWRREYLCQIVRDGGRICIPNFSYDLHVNDASHPEHANWITSIDFGGVKDKTVALFGYYDYPSASITVYDECDFDPNTDTDKIMFKVYQKEGIYPITRRRCDAAGQILVDLKSKHNYDTQLPLKDTLEAGLNMVRLLLDQGKLTIHPNCRLLIKTLHGGMLNKQLNDYERSKDLGHNDALAALIYLIRSADKTTNPIPKHKLNKFHYMTGPQKHTPIIDLGRSFTSPFGRK